MMKYKGCYGKARHDKEANVLHGEVVNITDVITFEGTTVNEIKQAFRVSVDDYLQFCGEQGEVPNMPY